MSIQNVGSLTSYASYRFFNKPVILIAIAVSIIAALGAYLYHKGYFPFTAKANPAAGTSGVQTPSLATTSTTPVIPSIRFHLNKASAEFILTDSNKQEIVLSVRMAQLLGAFQPKNFQYDEKRQRWVGFFSVDSIHGNYYDINENGMELSRNPENEYTRFSLEDLQQAMTDLEKCCTQVSRGVWIPNVVLNRVQQGERAYIEIHDESWRIIFLDGKRNTIEFEMQRDGRFSEIEFSESFPTPGAIDLVWYRVDKQKIVSLGELLEP